MFGISKSQICNWKGLTIDQMNGMNLLKLQNSSQGTGNPIQCHRLDHLTRESDWFIAPLEEKKVKR